MAYEKLDSQDVEKVVRALGGKVAANMEDSAASTASDLKDDFNELLDKLKAAGLMEADS